MVKKKVKKNFLASQANSTHKHSPLGSQIPEPISACKFYFRSPPGEIYARNLQSTLLFRIALKAERTFLLLVFFLEAGGAKWGRQERERPLESKLKRLGGKKVSKRKRGSLK